MKTYTYEDPETYILDDLIRFMDLTRDVDRRFVDDVYEYMQDYEYITENHMKVLSSIYREKGVKEYFEGDI